MTGQMPRLRAPSRLALASYPLSVMAARGAMSGPRSRRISGSALGLTCSSSQSRPLRPCFRANVFLPGPHGLPDFYIAFLRCAVSQGEFNLTVNQEYRYRIGMFMQDGLLARTVADPQDSHLIVLKCHRVSASHPLWSGLAPLPYSVREQVRNSR